MRYIVGSGVPFRAACIRRDRARHALAQTRSMLSPRHIRKFSLTGLGFALLCAISPVRAPAQDTLRIGTPRPPAASEPAEQELVTVPDLAGRTVAEARRLLAAAGLEVGRVAEGTGGGRPAQ